ncbi:MAG: CPBP family intramembrane glutamic endopeptidase [Salegentibacter sp.]
MASAENLIKTKLKNILRNYWLMLACYFLFFFILSLLSSVYPQIDFEKYRQTELFRLMNENPLKFGIMAVVIAPIIEESVFRSLVKPSENDILIFLCALLSLTAVYFIPVEAYWLLKYSLLLLSVFIIFIFLKAIIPQPLLARISRIFSRRYILIWLISATVFGLVHIGNYVEGWEFNLMLFLLIFPRIIAGFFFGKVKIENGSLLWPILLHAMNNGLIVLFSLPSLFNISL